MRKSVPSDSLSTNEVVDKDSDVPCTNGIRGGLDFLDATPVKSIILAPVLNKWRHIYMYVVISFLMMGNEGGGGIKADYMYYMYACTCSMPMVSCNQVSTKYNYM